uniref:Uncharacterized protein n=1 Tax=Arundo donax TaxID=35708 RepID=A0A0A8YNJ5_ARUDO
MSSVENLCPRLCKDTKQTFISLCLHVLLC